MSNLINNSKIDKATLPALERRGLEVSAFRVLKNAIFPAAQSDQSVLMAFDYCKARSLDPFKRVVHIVPIWDSKKRMLVDTVWPGIAELRTTASRTKQYAGKDTPVFGDTFTKKFGNVEVSFPEYCQITLYRMLEGQRVAFQCSPVYWLEACGYDKNNVPNKMWRTRPIGQLAKCAEAAALRETFPEELGGDYCAEEMEDKTIGGASEKTPKQSNMMSSYGDSYIYGAYNDDDFTPSQPPVAPQEPAITTEAGTQPKGADHD